MSDNTTTGTPFPFRLPPLETGDVMALKARYGLNKSEIVRRCLYYSLPRFLSGEVDITRIVSREEEPSK